MLTHHQYTDFQQHQKYTEELTPSDFKRSGSNRTAAKSDKHERSSLVHPFDGHATGECHLIGSACCLIGSDKPCFDYIHEDRFSATSFSQNICNNHFESNLLFRVADGEIGYRLPMSRIAIRTDAARTVAPPKTNPAPPRSKRLRSTLEQPQGAADTPPIYQEDVQESGYSVSEAHPGLRKTNLQNYIKCIENSSEFMTILQQLATIDWPRVDRSEFVGLVTQDIYFTTAFQTYLQQTEVTSPLERQILAVIEELALDKYGCHILRIVVKKSASILKACATSLLNNFRANCGHEFTNKVMQAVAAEDEKFRIGCLVRIKKYWNELKLSVSSIYLLTVCLRNTPSWNPRFQAIGIMLLKKSAHLLRDRNDKRMLARYLEFCDPAEVEKFYQTLHFEKEFQGRFDDKYMVYIFRLLLRRGHASSIRLLKEILCLEVEAALDAGPFRQLLREIVSESEKWVHLSDQLFAQLRQIKTLCSWNRPRIGPRPKLPNPE